MDVTQSWGWLYVCLIFSLQWGKIQQPILEEEIGQVGTQVDQVSYVYRLIYLSI